MALCIIMIPGKQLGLTEDHANCLYSSFSYGCTECCIMLVPFCCFSPFFAIIIVSLTVATRDLVLFSDSSL